MNLKKLSWGIRVYLYKLYGCKIGFASYIGKPVFIRRFNNIHLGNKCRIYPGLRVELVNTESYLTIGNNVSIGQNCHFVSFSDNLIIGNDVTISGNVFISNCEHQYQKIGEHILNQPLDKGKTIIGDNCFLGYGCVIQAGVILGKQCIVGSNTVIKRGRYPDYSVIVGVPGKVVKKFDFETGIWRKL